MDKFKFEDVSAKYGGQKTWAMRNGEGHTICLVFPARTCAYEAYFKDRIIRFHARKQVVAFLRDLTQTPKDVIENLIRYE